MIETAYDFYVNPDTASSLDDILLQLDVTHKDFRQYCVDNNHPLPRLSQGLIAEARGLGPAAKALYHLSHEDYAIFRRGGRAKLVELGRKCKVELDVTKVHQLRLQGMPVSLIAERFGVNVSRVYQVTKGNKYPKPCTPELRAKKAKIVEKHAQGMSVPDLVKEFNVTRNTIYLYLREQQDA